MSARPQSDAEPEDPGALPFRFEGVESPNGTIFPDVLLDRVMPHLSGAEFKVLAYIVRRTFGFKKESDTISLDQICRGITRRDGSVLDEGTGLARKTAVAAIHGLEAKGVILCRRRSSPEKGNLPTSYALRFKGQPRTTPDTELHQGGSEKEPGGGEAGHQPGSGAPPAPGTALHPQPTVVQPTVPQGGAGDTGRAAGGAEGRTVAPPPAPEMSSSADLATVWTAALAGLAASVGEVSARAWLAPARLRALDGATATLEVPHAPALRWIERHLDEAVRAELAAVTGRALALRLVLPGGDSRAPAPAAAPPPAGAEAERGAPPSRIVAGAPAGRPGPALLRRPRRPRAV